MRVCGEEICLQKTGNSYCRIYKLTDIGAWENGEHKEFTGNGMCFADLNAECCCINGIVNDGQLYINEDDVIVCV